MKKRIIDELIKRMKLKNIFKSHSTDIHMKKDGKYFNIDRDLFNGLNSFNIIVLDNEGVDFIRYERKNLTLEQVAEWIINY